MRVGYYGDLRFKLRSHSDIDRVGSDLTELAVKNHVDYLILNGGISNDFILTLQFIDRIEQMLKLYQIKLKFLLGNTDFYGSIYSGVDKRRAFQEKLAEVAGMPSYLPCNPIMLQGARIYGAESWYDYSLYRGKPVALRSITKKSFWLRKNPDVKYITDRDDYISGLDNCFDVCYTNKCLRSLDDILDRDENRFIPPDNLVVAMYFYPSKVFLSDGYFERYWGTFKGSDKFLGLFQRHRVSTCVFGLTADRKYAELEGIRFHGSGQNFMVGDYNVG